MRALVIGAGAWGLPAGAELARRGHEVTVLDAYGAGNRFSSSSGATRLWRLSHPDDVRTRLALRSVEAWERLERRTGSSLLLRRGLLWRGPDAGTVANALQATSIEHVYVDAADVASYFPGLRPSADDAVWQEVAGPVWAERAIAAHLAVLEQSGGQLLAGRLAVGVDVSASSVLVDHVAAPAAPGGTPGTDVVRAVADAVVVAAGPLAPPLLAQVGVAVEQRPVLEQVTYVVGRPGWEDLPCLVESTGDGALGMGAYTMPTPGIGYKIGLEQPLRDFTPGDADRTPSPQVEAAAVAFARDEMGFADATAVMSQVCSWTESPDGMFVIDRLHDGRVVVATGDSGQGFKFSAVMGELLADLAEGAPVDADVATFSLARFAPHR